MCSQYEYMTCRDIQVNKETRVGKQTNRWGKEGEGSGGTYDSRSDIANRSNKDIIHLFQIK